MFYDAGYKIETSPVDKDGNKDIIGNQFLRDYFYPDFRKIMFLDDTVEGNSRFNNESKLRVDLYYKRDQPEEKIYPI
jgi:hypothetical protein